MQNKPNVLLCLLVILFCAGKYIYAQESTHKPGLRFAIVGQFPLMRGFAKDSYNENLTKVSQYQIGIETNWKPKKSRNIHFAFNLLYGTYLYRYSIEKYNRNQPTAELAFSTFFGSKVHFFELGVGMDFEGLAKAFIGYRGYMWKDFFLKAQILRSSYVLAGWDHIKFWDFSFGMGYQFNKNTTRHVVNGVNFIYHRSWLGIEVFPAPIDKYDDGHPAPAPPVLVNYGFIPYKSDKVQLLLSVGVGSITDGNSVTQTGMAIIYGQNKHFMEAGINFIFSLLRNPNYDYKYSEYVLPQPQIGYRYQFAKNRWFAKAAYAPYIRIYNWKREGGIYQNIVLGFGFKLAKDKE